MIEVINPRCRECGFSFTKVDSLKRSNLGYCSESCMNSREGFIEMLREMRDSGDPEYEFEVEQHGFKNEI